MSYIDIAIIVIFAGFTLIGLWKGLLKTLVGFLGWTLALVFALLLARVVADALLGIEGLRNLILGEGSSLFGLVKSFLPGALSSLPSGVSSSAIEAALAGDSVMSALVKPLIPMLTSMEAAVSVGDGIALLIANSLFTLIVGAVLFIVFKIIFMIIGAYIKIMFKQNGMSWRNRLFGMLAGAAQGMFYVVIIFVGMSYIITSSMLVDFRTELSKSALGKPISEQVFSLTDKYLNGDEGLLNKLLSISGRAPKYAPSENELDLLMSVKFFDIYNVTPESLAGGTIFESRINNLASYNDSIRQKLSSGQARDVDISSLVALTKGTDSAMSRAYKGIIDDITAYKASTMQSEKDSHANKASAGYNYLLMQYTQFDSLLGLSINRELESVYVMSADEQLFVTYMQDILTRALLPYPNTGTESFVDTPVLDKVTQLVAYDEFIMAAMSSYGTLGKDITLATAAIFPHKAAPSNNIYLDYTDLIEGAYEYKKQETPEGKLGFQVKMEEILATIVGKYSVLSDLLDLPHFQFV